MLLLNQKGNSIFYWCRALIKIKFLEMRSLFRWDALLENKGVFQELPSGFKP